MKNKQLKRLGKILFSLTLIFSSIGITNTYVADAKKSSTPRPSAKPSSKPTSSKPNAKPSSQTSSNKPTSNSSSKNSKGTYNKNYNSYNNKGYKKQYTEYLNNNYRNSGFFSGSSITNALLWYTLFNSTASRNHIHASDKQKELVKNEFNKLFTSLNIENIEIKFINYEIDKTKKLKRIVRKVEK